MDASFSIKLMGRGQNPSPAYWMILGAKKTSPDPLWLQQTCLYKLLSWYDQLSTAD